MPDSDDAPWLPGWGSIRVAKTATFTPTASDRGVTFDCSGGAFACNLPALAAVSAGFHFAIVNAASGGSITITPNGAETIAFAGFGTTLASTQVPNGGAVVLWSNGTTWVAVAPSGFRTAAIGQLVRSLAALATLTDNDFGKTVICTGGPYTVTLPAASKECGIYIRGSTTAAVTVAAAGADTISRSGISAGSVVLGPGEGAWFVTIGTGAWHMLAETPDRRGAIAGLLSGAVSDGTYTLVGYAPRAMTITGLNHKSSAGTADLTVEINGTPVTGLTAVGVTSSRDNDTATAANVVAAGDLIELIVASAAGLTDLDFTLKVTG